LPIAYGHKQQSTKSAAGETTVVAAAVVGSAAMEVATVTGMGMLMTTGMAT